MKLNCIVEGLKELVKVAPPRPESPYILSEREGIGINPSGPRLI